MTERGIEQLNLNIYWYALTEEEQQTLHHLLSKAHQGYCDFKKQEIEITYEDAIRACIASGKADQILNSDKANALRGLAAKRNSPF